jgi:hypothetical protein
MPVLSVSLPASREAVLGLSCLKHGIEANKIDTEGSMIYVDLTGDTLMTLRAALAAGAEPLAVVTYTEAPKVKPGEAGRYGEGIPLDDTINREQVYGSLMAMAR